MKFEFYASLGLAFRTGAALHMPQVYTMVLKNYLDRCCDMTTISQCKPHYNHELVVLPPPRFFDSVLVSCMYKNQWSTRFPSVALEEEKWWRNVGVRQQHLFDMTNWEVTVVLPGCNGSVFMRRTWDKLPADVRNKHLYSKGQTLLVPSRIYSDRR